jgi:hypothetical protein
MSKLFDRDYRVVVLRPDDVLIISNVGEANAYSVPQQAVDNLRADLKCKAVYLFSDDINYDILRSDTDPLAPEALGKVATDE